MKTGNKQIDIFTNENKALVAFNNCNTSCDLLHAASYKSWYVDKSKTALKAWPNLYKLIATK